MGLATLPSASEGVLCVILVNSAVPFAVIRYLFRAVLLIFGVRLDSTSENSDESPDSYIDEFRSRTPAVKFDSVLKKAKEDEEHDCVVCLSGLELDSEINELSCGHVFHKECLEQWIDYWNITCPLCRTPLMVLEDDVHCSFW